MAAPTGQQLVVVTDDELLATAALLGMSWVRPLLTVDPSSRPQVAAAVVRGTTTLALRGLLVGDELDGALHHVVVAVGDTVPALTAYEADAALDHVPGSPIVEWYAGHDLLRVAALTGVNTFSTATREAAVTLVAGLADDTDGERHTVVLGPDAAGRRAGLVASRLGGRRMEVGQARDAEFAKPLDWPAAVRDLLVAVG
ncbi:hypothetical protein KMZ32_18285 [Phycicoccus sp. MAQZ13P-2]|uniref:hypothetical protein n=1 Tax=Phycicoccus mangrovi TaxID=2840470 RepID=UPI001C0009D0|nr:hypothetical protein [Phycicoccus mangrovi]MBT9258043.1 hypothetical protein [Phycicoccus mangrovi]MBT9276027.1 hypothetical protein [Phycicoccus mangrovi]